MLEITAVVVAAKGKVAEETMMAATAVSAWLGARVFRAHEVRETRQVLNTVSAIQGNILPARTVRGLA